MGQKTHPKAFRLSITNNYRSVWYATKGKYSKFLQKDSFIRNKINEILGNLMLISEIKILRGGSMRNSAANCTVIIKALHPRIAEITKTLSRELNSSSFEVDPSFVKELANFNKTENKNENQIKNLIKSFLCLKVRTLNRALNLELENNITFKFDFIHNPFTDASLIAKTIGDQIQARIPFRRILKQSIQKAEIAGLAGIKVQLAGRLNGIDIARTEWKKEGPIPLHTLKAKIDCSFHYVETVYGLIGIKVWIYKL